MDLMRYGFNELNKHLTAPHQANGKVMSCTLGQYRLRNVDHHESMGGFNGMKCTEFLSTTVINKFDQHRSPHAVTVP